MKKFMKFGAVSALSLVIGASAAFAENIKTAFIDPLSSPFASTGTNGLHQFQDATVRRATRPAFQIFTG